MVSSVIGNDAKKMIVLGIDGMDPNLLKMFINKGKLPNFKKIIYNGGDFKKLATSFPPQSPVAWSNFIIGANPGKHGIFDFIHRDPKTLTPYLSIICTEGYEVIYKLGDFSISSPGRVKNMRGGIPFWDYLCEKDIPTTIMQIPANYPPTYPKKSAPLKSLSGMGTPDVLGSQGTFSFYTSEDIGLKETIGGGKVYLVDVKNQKVESKIYGPPNPYKNPDAYENTADTLVNVPFTVWVDEENDVAKIDIDGNEIILNKGEFSDWVKIDFYMIPIIRSFSGIVKFYLKECHPQFKLYVSPININPEKPVIPISFPPSFSKEIFKELGYFYTQNMPIETKALEHGIFSDDEILKQKNIVFQEEEKRLYRELENFKEGFLYHYFCVNDQLSHVFWRTIDPMHPLYTDDLNKKYGHVIEELYMAYDKIVAKTLEYVDDDTLLIIMSDHGFTSFRRTVHTNTILLNNGYISLVNPEDQGKSEFFKNVNWEETKAYNLGINAVYINLYGREPEGIVFEDEYDEVCEEIRSMLLNYVDPKNGKHPIKHVARREEIYSGPYVANAPDLIIGYEDGYRGSWKTILGQMPEEEIEDNTSPWSGDHCISADIVPGIIVSNKKIKMKKPSLIDLAPTILDYFNIRKGDQMEGESIFK